MRSGGWKYIPELFDGMDDFEQQVALNLLKWPPSDAVTKSTAIYFTCKAVLSTKYIASKRSKRLAIRVLLSAMMLPATPHYQRIPEYPEDGIEIVVSQLKPHQQELLAMIYGLKGHLRLSQAEIADNRGVSRQAVNHGLINALNALRRILGVSQSPLKNIGVCAKIVLGIEVTKDDVMKLVRNSNKSQVRK